MQSKYTCDIILSLHYFSLSLQYFWRAKMCKSTDNDSQVSLTHRLHLPLALMVASRLKNVPDVP